MARFSIRGDAGAGACGDGEGSSNRRPRKRLRLRDEEEGREEFSGGRNDGSSGEENEDEEEGEEEQADVGSEEEEEEEADIPLAGPENSPVESRSPTYLLSELRNYFRTSKRHSPLSVTLLDPDILDCSICYEPLTIPIFQCENGHIACSSCCINMGNKCPCCSLPIGYNRCRAMEKVLESVRVPCPNVKYGCEERLSHSSRSTHENECSFAPCFCPARSCDFTNAHKQLYKHYSAKHKDSQIVFVCGRPFSITLDRSGMNSMVVLQEEKDGELIVVQRFRDSLGESVTMSCIAPPVQGTGVFSYSLSFRALGGSLSFELSGVRKIQKVIHSRPVSDFVLIPSYLLLAEQVLKLELCIRRTGRTRVLTTV